MFKYGIRVSGRTLAQAVSVLALIVVSLLLFWPKVEYADDTISGMPTSMESTPASPATPAPEPAATPPSVPMSAPTAIYMPGSDKTRIKTTPIALKCGTKSIPYPESGPNFWRSFYCTDRAMPGTNMPHYGIITGHSSWSEDTVMGRLLLRKDSLVGKRIYIRTEKSGKKWLAFTFKRIEVVDKDHLQDAKAWGGKRNSTANQLVWLTCGQVRYGYDRTVNVLMVAEFTEVVDSL